MKYVSAEIAQCSLSFFFLGFEYSMVLLSHDQEREEQHAECFVILHGLVVVLQVVSLAPSGV